jgi:hypothetical protein
MLSPRLCAREKRVPLSVAPPRDGLQTPWRVASGKGITMSVRKSIILLTLTAVTLTVASPQAAAAQQTAPASAPAAFDVADRAAILVAHGVGAQIYECKVARLPQRIGFFANLSLPSSWAAGQ